MESEQDNSRVLGLFEPEARAIGEGVAAAKRNVFDALIGEEPPTRIGDP
jgi:hypothetical protein